MIYADMNRIIQIITNLLSNSIKYTRPRGDIDLSVEIKEDRVNLTVKDTGIGIPKDQLKNIFEIFSQVELKNYNGQFGLGIGLSLVKELVEMHKIEGNSKGKGKGSEFVLTLPLMNGDNSMEEVQGETFDSTANRILIVDNETDAADKIYKKLRQSNYQVEIC